MFRHSFHKRVRYAETDKMGYLYYGHYAKYYEIGRVEALRHLGISYKDMEEKMGLMLPVLQLESRYISSAYYDDNIEIVTILKDMPTKLIAFDHELKNKEGKIINKAHIKLFFIEMSTGKRVSAPEQLVDRLRPYF